MPCRTREWRQLQTDTIEGSLAKEKIEAECKMLAELERELALLSMTAFW